MSVIENDKWISANLAVLRLANKTEDLIEAQDQIGRLMLSGRVDIRSQKAWVQASNTITPKWHEEPDDENADLNRSYSRGRA
jgi:hypothetical protein